MTKSERHDNCYDSSSPRYKPTPSRPPTSDGPHRASARRYPATSGKANPSEWHHYSSQIDRPARAYSAPPRHNRSRSSGQRQKALEPPPCFRFVLIIKNLYISLINVEILLKIFLASAYDMISWSACSNLNTYLW